MPMWSLRHQEHHARVRSQLAQTRRPRQHRRAPGQGESELDASIAGRVRVVAQTRDANSGVMPNRISLPIPWMEAMVELGILWWVSKRDANPPMTLPCSERQASQAPR